MTINAIINLANRFVLIVTNLDIGFPDAGQKGVVLKDKDHVTRGDLRRKRVTRSSKRIKRRKELTKLFTTLMPNLKLGLMCRTWLLILQTMAPPDLDG